MLRVSIVGPWGSGKSTLGPRLASSLGVPYVELDAIFHLPNWTHPPTDEFRASMREIVASDGWVIDGNHSTVRDLVWERADTVVWLDLPRSVAMRRVITRTLRRMITRERLWNGNRERLTDLFRLDPNENVIRAAWVQHAELRARYVAAVDDPTNAHLRIIPLRSQTEIDAFLA
jgi:adenylate kinase family enzyme